MACSVAEVGPGLWSGRPCPGQWVASGKPVVGLIHFLLSLPLAYCWLTAGLPLAYQWGVWNGAKTTLSLETWLFLTTCPERSLLSIANGYGSTIPMHRRLRTVAVLGSPRRGGLAGKAAGLWRLVRTGMSALRHFALRQAHAMGVRITRDAFVRPLRHPGLTGKSAPPLLGMSNASNPLPVCLSH
jgi:hypothetical protein